MDTSEATGLLPPLEWADPKSQLLQDTWLLTLFTVLLAIALPWFVSSFNIDFASASWAMLVLGAIYVGLAMVANLKPDVAVRRRRGLIALHTAGVIAIGLLWQRSGGLQNPVFLLAFVLPVIGASALSRGQPYITAALAVLVSAAVALSQAPELRWYAAGLHALGRVLSGLFGAGAQGGSAASAFPGFYAPVGFDVVLLEVFAILIFACAVAAESLANAFERLLNHLDAARTEAVRGQHMWTTLVRQLPVPALLIDADTLQIVLASECTAPFHAAEASLVGQGLLEAIRFSYPERVQEMVAGQGGIATHVVVHVAEELRMATIRVQHLVYEGRRLALVLIEDTSAAFCVGAALDAAEHAAVVIDARGRLVAANRLARALFPEAPLGSDASLVLSRSSATAHWWEPGLTGWRRTQVTLSRRAYQANCTAVGVPGEQEALYVITLTPLLTSTAAVEGTVSALR